MPDIDATLPPCHHAHSLLVPPVHAAHIELEPSQDSPEQHGPDDQSHDRVHARSPCSPQHSRSSASLARLIARYTHSTTSGWEEVSFMRQTRSALATCPWTTGMCRSIALLRSATS